MTKYIVIIPCAGNGSRFKASLPKQYHKIGTRTVLEWAIVAFSQISSIHQIFVITNPADAEVEQIIAKYPKVCVAKVGGSTRAKTVINAINYIKPDCNDWILVHDAARCCIHPEDIKALIDGVGESDVGGILAQKAVDTVKQLSFDRDKVLTLDRSNIYLAQTPQMFRASVLTEALKDADLEKITDEASAIELKGLAYKLIDSSNYNLKITYPEDLNLAQAILSQRNY